MSRIHRLSIALAASALLLALGAPGASAASRVGIRGGFSSGPDQLVVGAHVQVSPIAEHLYIVPSAEAGFGDDVFTLAFNGDLQYQFGPQGSLRPYAGGGLTLMYADPDGGDSDTNLGVSALGGLLFDRKSGWPIFLEAKLGLSDEVPDFKLMVGLMFR